MKRYLIYLPFLLALILFIIPYPKKANAACSNVCVPCTYSTCHLEAGQYLVPKSTFGYPSNRCINYPYIGYRCSLTPQRDLEIHDANGDIAGICSESLCGSSVPLNSVCGIVGD